MGGASTGGIANVNLNVSAVNKQRVSHRYGQQNASQLTGQLPVYDVTEQLQPVLDALDGLSHAVTLTPVVGFVLPLREQTAALARAAPLPL